MSTTLHMHDLLSVHAGDTLIRHVCCHGVDGLPLDLTDARISIEWTIATATGVPVLAKRTGDLGVSMLSPAGGTRSRAWTKSQDNKKTMGVQAICC
jgi:hypothetical protein